MKTLVTGATGFVGACLTRHLVAQGDEVHLLTRHESDRWRIADLMPDLVDHQVDLRDAAGVERVVREIRPETVYHCAAYGGFAFQRESDAILGANFLGTVNLLKACAATGFSLFVNTGSSSEYGCKQQPMRESDLLEPLGDYAVAKAAATLYCRSEALLKELPVVTLRLFSPYGPWDDKNRFIPYLLSTLLRGEVPLLSTPSSVRDYVYMDDIAALYLGLAGKRVTPGAIYNVGSGVQQTIGDVVTQAIEIIDTSIEPRWGGIKQQRPEPACWVADMSETRSALGWAAATPFRKGLEKTMQWLRERQEV
jgi:nucleoside-diphosphate-sugar epimerase